MEEISYAEKMLKAYKDFDTFLSKYPETSPINFYSHSIRNLYAAYEENRFNKKFEESYQALKEYFGIFILVFFSKIILSKKNKVILLNINPRIDEELSKKIGASLSTPINKISFNLKAIPSILIWFNISIKLLFSKELNKFYVFKVLPSLLLGIHCYKTIDVKGVKKIITQRDRYPKEWGIITKAKENNIKTVRIEAFAAMEKINRNSILCDYYFYPNNLAKEIFSSFKYNKSVKFIKGGFPYWDYLEKINHNPSTKPKMISFWTQYGQEMGIFGEKGPEFYIKEIISIMPKEYELYIKVHPLEDSKKYEKFVSKRVKVVKHGDLPNEELISKSSFIFSINSFSIFEAKHVINNAFYINYDPGLTLDFNYNYITDYIDLISNKEDLKLFLSGEKVAKDKNEFIKFFNPSFPKTSEKLKDFIKKI